MPRKQKVTLEFGLADAVPTTAACAWGARLIFPDDLLFDRQGYWKMHEPDGQGGRKRTPDGQKLVEWLNGGAISKALANARKMANRYEISQTKSKLVVLHEDAQGKIVGDSLGSCGYLYISGWLKRAA